MHKATQESLSLQRNLTKAMMFSNRVSQYSSPWGNVQGEVPSVCDSPPLYLDAQIQLPQSYYGHNYGDEQFDKCGQPYELNQTKQYIDQENASYNYFPPTPNSAYDEEVPATDISCVYKNAQNILCWDRGCSPNMSPDVTYQTVKENMLEHQRQWNNNNLYGQVKNVEAATDRDINDIVSIVDSLLKDNKENTICAEKGSNTTTQFMVKKENFELYPFEKEESNTPNQQCLLNTCTDSVKKEPGLFLQESQHGSTHVVGGSAVGGGVPVTAPKCPPTYIEHMSGKLVSDSTPGCGYQNKQQRDEGRNSCSPQHCPGAGTPTSGISFQDMCLSAGVLNGK